jgi:hypothetical protein
MRQDLVVIERKREGEREERVTCRLPSRRMLCCGGMKGKEKTEAVYPIS